MNNHPEKPVIVSVGSTSYSLAPQYREMIETLLHTVADQVHEECVRVKVTDVGRRVIAVIKVVRTYTGWTLRECKAYVDSVRGYMNPPNTRQLPMMTSERAEEFAQELRAAGARAVAPSIFDQLAKIAEAD